MDKIFRGLISLGAVCVAAYILFAGLFLHESKELEGIKKAKESGGYVDDTLYTWNTRPERICTDGETGHSYAEGEVLVSFEKGISRRKAEKEAEKYGASLVGLIASTGDCQWYFEGDYSYQELQKLAEEIRQENGVAYAMVNYVTELEAAGGAFEDVDLSDYSATNGEKERLIHLQGAWKVFEEAVSEKEPEQPVNVGIIDTCFASDHEDLKFAGLFYNYANYDIRNSINKYESEDSKNQIRHGTHVAGIIGAAYRNNKGIDGTYPLAYDQKNKISHLYGVSNWGLEEYNEKHRKNTFSLCQEMEWLFRHQVKVINRSMGYTGETVEAGKKGDLSVQVQEAKYVGEYLEKTLEYGREFLIVESAGNESSLRAVDCRVSSVFANVSQQEFPNAYSRIIIVGNCTLKRKRYRSSCAGERVDLMAPGVDITSAIPEGGYQSMTGTSMSAPYVTGTAAMMWTLAPELSGKEIKNQLLNPAIYRSERNFLTLEPEYPVLNAEVAVKMAMLEGAKIREEQQETGETETEVIHPDFEGEWVDKTDGHLQMEVIRENKSQYTVSITEKKDEKTRIVWDLLGKYDPDQGGIVYSEGIQYRYYFPDGGEPQETVLYKDGHGMVYLEDGYLYWRDDKEQAGAGCVFEKKKVEKEITVADEFRKYIQDTLAPEYGIMDTEDLYTEDDTSIESATWKKEDMNGILSATVKDLDRDGQEELLAVCWETVPVEDCELCRFLYDTFLSLRIYEYRDGTVSMSAEKKIQAGDYGVGLTSCSLHTCCFIYEYEGQVNLAVDTFDNVHESTVTLMVLEYDGEQIRFQHGVGYHRAGEGDVGVYEMIKEPDEGLLATCAPYHYMQNDGEGNVQLKSPWKTLKEYWIDQHEDKNLFPQEEAEYYNLYREKVSELGLEIRDDRIDPNIVYDSDIYEKLRATDVYVEWAGKITYLSGISSIRYSKSRDPKPKCLERRDYEGTLDFLR